MSRYNEKNLSYGHQDRLINMFCEILSQLKTRQVIRNFIKDLLNRQERIMLVRRLLIAEMLMDGYTYLEIISRLRCGAQTIARVERWLNFGRGGYRKAIKVKRVR